MTWSQPKHCFWEAEDSVPSLVKVSDVVIVKKNTSIVLFLSWPYYLILNLILSNLEINTSERLFEGMCSLSDTRSNSEGKSFLMQPLVSSLIDSLVIEDSCPSWVKVY